MRNEPAEHIFFIFERMFDKGDLPEVIFVELNNKDIPIGRYTWDAQQRFYLHEDHDGGLSAVCVDRLMREGIADAIDEQMDLFG